MTSQFNFEDFMKDFDDSLQGHTPAYVNKKTTDRKAVGHRQENSNDKDHTLINVWDVLKSNNIDRKIVEHITIEFNNLNNVIEKMVVCLNGGHEAILFNVQLKD